MKNLYEYAYQKVRSGAGFEFDFKTKSFKVDKKLVVENGKCVLNDYEILPTSAPFSFDALTDLYINYKYSKPTQRSECRKRHTFFKALPEEKLNAEDMLYAEHRDIEQFNLEAYIFSHVLDGSFKWNEEIMGKWYWQSPFDKDLVLLRQWFE